MGFSENKVPECSEEAGKRLADFKGEGTLLVKTEILGDFDIVKDKIKIAKNAQKIDICIDGNNQLVRLKDEIIMPVIKEEKPISLDDIEKSIVMHQTGHFTVYSESVIYLPRNGESLWSIVEDIYGYETDTEIANKIIQIAKINKISNKEIIQKGEKIIFPIDNASGVIERLDEIENNKIQKTSEDKKSKELQNIEDLRKEKSNKSDESNNKSLFKAEISGELDDGLDNNKFSGELNSNAYEIFKNLKNTRGEQIIGTYRNKDWEVKNIVLGDNNGKNIYMELDESYTWDDISEDNLENINNLDDLKEVMKKILNKYEQEVKN